MTTQPTKTQQETTKTTKKKRKCVVDTSAVRPAISSSTTDHNTYFRETFADDTLMASTYIRMEVIRRWVCDFIRAALLVKMYASVSDALALLEQDFGSRQCKSTVAMVCSTLRRNGTLQDTAAAAEEVGRMAVAFLDTFDAVFPARIDNRSRCQIGGRGLDVDFNTLLVDLQQFYEGFVKPVTNCEINSFLQLAKPRGRCQELIENKSSRKREAVKALKTFQHTSTHITCVECSQLGDAVIALEMPRKLSIVHTDKSFVGLCKALGLTSIKIKSAIAIHNERVAAGGPKADDATSA
jgi:hypothetical protein